MHVPSFIISLIAIGVVRSGGLESVSQFFAHGTCDEGQERSGSICYVGCETLKCTKKHSDKWPHCSNVSCFHNTLLVDAFNTCDANPACNGFSFEKGKIYGNGCYKKDCANDGVNGFGYGSHDYWECGKEKKGYTGNGPVCWEQCKPSYTNNGVACARGGSTYSSNHGSCPWYDVCGLTFSRGCSNCNNHPGSRWDGCTCHYVLDNYTKESWGRGAGYTIKTPNDAQWRRKRLKREAGLACASNTDGLVYLKFDGCDYFYKNCKKSVVMGKCSGGNFMDSKGYIWTQNMDDMDADSLPLSKDLFWFSALPGLGFTWKANYVISGPIANLEIPSCTQSYSCDRRRMLADRLEGGQPADAPVGGQPADGPSGSQPIDDASADGSTEGQSDELAE